MPETIYLLCALTSVLCAILLARSYRRSRSRMLLWSTLGFAGLAVNNVLLFVDLVVARHVDLSLWRSASGLAGCALLVTGLVLEGR